MHEFCLDYKIPRSLTILYYLVPLWSFVFEGYIISSDCHADSVISVISMPLSTLNCTFRLFAKTSIFQTFVVVTFW